MIRELKNPLYDITWNCKNNYDVYTTDYDLYGSHFDRVSMEVMEVERILHAIRKLEKKVKLPWTWSTDERDTDLQTLWELKKELGIPKDQPAPTDALDVRSAINEATLAHASKPRSPGFIKA